MEVKKPIQSKSYWYYIFVVVGSIVTAILADNNFKELIGSYAVFLVILDKGISFYLRSITTKKIEWRKPREKLNPLDEALRQDSLEIKEI